MIHCRCIVLCINTIHEGCQLGGFFFLIFDIWYGTNNNTVLASMRIGPHVGAVSCGGCEGTIWDGAGRVGAVAFETAATENPGEQRPSPTAVVMTGALILKGTHRTVGSIYFRLWAGACAIALPPEPKKVISEEVGRCKAPHAKTCQGGTLAGLADCHNRGCSCINADRAPCGRRILRRMRRHHLGWGRTGRRRRIRNSGDGEPRG